MSIDKKFLKAIWDSKEITPWVLNARGFLFSAAATQKGLMSIQAERKGRKHLPSNEDISQESLCYKVACYLLSHSIELSLKAIYIAAKNESAERFSHKVIKIFNALVAEGSINEQDYEENVLKLADILLNWYGRYHKPSEKNVDSVINNLFYPVSGSDNLIQRNIPLTKTSYQELKITAEKLLEHFSSESEPVSCLLSDPSS